MPPNDVSSKFITQFDVFTASGNELKQKLDLLLKYNVNQEKIITAQVFRFSIAHLQRTLEELKANRVENVKAWMVAVGKTMKNTIIKRSQEEQKSADGSSSGIEYIANRLNWNKLNWEMAIKSEPHLAKISLFKVSFSTEFNMKDIRKIYFYCRQKAIWIFS